MLCGLLFADGAFRVGWVSGAAPGAELFLSVAIQLGDRARHAPPPATERGAFVEPAARIIAGQGAAFVLLRGRALPGWQPSACVFRPC